MRYKILKSDHFIILLPHDESNSIRWIPLFSIRSFAIQYILSHFFKTETNSLWRPMCIVTWEFSP